MKKSLLAVAAMTAFAGAAQAQSSVTVYGIVDAGYTGGNARLATGSTVTKETVSRIGNSMESGSRIGFRGNEDLGGGTAAIFTFELGIQPAGNAGSNSNGTGTASATAPTASSASNAGSPNWTPNVRQAFIGFEKKGMGNARVGFQNTLFWEQAGSNTTGQLSQTLGSMLAPSSDGAFFTGNLSTAANSYAGNSLGAYTSRTSNTVRIATERMAGLVGKAAYTLSSSDTNQTTGTAGGYTGGNNNQTGYQLAVDYVIQKANIQASYASFKSENPTAIGTAAAVNATGLATVTAALANQTALAWGTGTQGTNSIDTQSLITASYDFGILKAYAGWTDRKVSSTLNSNNYLKRQAQEIGVRSFITPTIEGWASVGNGRYTAQGVNSPTANITGYQLGSNYYLSKRTNLYAIYGQNGTSSSSSGAFNVNQYSIGARHTF